jgi:phospholipid-binding lipoprotein MlaA
MPSFRRPAVAILLLVLLSACAGPGVRDAGDNEETYDPFESFNRAMFRFNDEFDRWLLKPVARGYDWLLPGPVKSGVGNFFSNLLQPSVAVNDLLQGKPAQSTRDAGRFVVNTTVGIAGFFDVAKLIGLDPKDEDWGQTFAVWGVKEGPYFVWPIIGPRSLRDTFGWGFDWVSTPVTYVQPPAASWELRSADVVDIRARLLPAEKVLNEAAGQDRYIFFREAYRQSRRNLVFDGNPPKPKFFEDESDDNRSPTSKPDTTPTTPAPAATPAAPAP